MTDSTAELQAIRQELAEIRAALPAPRKRKPDHRCIFSCRFELDEVAAIDAAAAQKGLSRSEFVRATLASVVGFVVATRNEQPPQLRHARNRRKPSHFHDPKSPIERDTREIARQAVSHGLKAKSLMRELDAATSAPVPAGMLTETAAVRISVPKPSR